MRSIIRRALAATGTLAVLVCSSPRSEAGSEYTCSEVFGFVAINELTVDPPKPRVGDRVTLHFDVRYQVYGVSTLKLLGTEPFLEGATIRGGDRSARFELDAVQPGETSVTLEVVYQNEDRCENEAGHYFFAPGAYRTVRSSPRPLVIEPGPPCLGDCNGDGRVTVDELIRALNVALGSAILEGCPNGNLPGDSIIEADDVVTIIDNMLRGCP